MALPVSEDPPPRNLEKTSVAPFADSLVTNASCGPSSPGAAAIVFGKLADVVEPVTYASPAASTAMPRPLSLPPPPRYVEYTSDAPDAENLVTNAFCAEVPPSAPCSGLCTGKSADLASPVT